MSQQYLQPKTATCCRASLRCEGLTPRASRISRLLLPITPVWPTTNMCKTTSCHPASRRRTHICSCCLVLTATRSAKAKSVVKVTSTRCSRDDFDTPSTFPAGPCSESSSSTMSGLDGSLTNCNIQLGSRLYASSWPSASCKMKQSPCWPASTACTIWACPFCCSERPCHSYCSLRYRRPSERQLAEAGQTPECLVCQLSC